MREGNSVFNKIKRFAKDAKGVLFTVIILAAVIYFFGFAVNGASAKADASSAAALEKAIRRAAVQCYAVEGFYPPDVNYLTERYGVIIDAAKYTVEYNSFSVNNIPNIKVIY